MRGLFFHQQDYRHRQVLSLAAGDLLLRYRHSEALINPGWRCIGREDYQGDQNQTEQQG
jgi:hypothetical protein